MEDRQPIANNDRSIGPYPELKLKVTAESLSFFTTVLQFGIEFETLANIPLGKFLCDCPGFSEEYLSESVQTIFLDGTAIDDLQTPLSGRHPVVALSAAMPGLAGAIFRKNSLHSVLRSTTADCALNHKTQGPLAVTLKLFNRVAYEKGELLLSSGAVIASSSLSVFLEKRPELLNKIKTAAIDTVPASPEDLPYMLRDHEFIKLFISAKPGGVTRTNK